MAGTPLNKAVPSLLCGLILALIGILAFSIRLFSVIKYESVIHEFDPYFNYRVTQYLAKEGIFNLWNWFDVATWYPLGRNVGGTVFPGLTVTAGTLHYLLHKLNIPIAVQEVCVFTAPLFSAFCAWAAFLLVREVRGSGAGLCAAALMAMVPSYISRSVAGSYDNEGVAIFALVFTFFLYIKTLNTGSLAWGTANALAYFYMVCSWGGYTFIINLLPIHVLVMLFGGRFSPRLYVAYAPLVLLGTLLAACIPAVGFNAILTSEHFASQIVFVILNVTAAGHYLGALLPRALYRAAAAALLSAVALAAVPVALATAAYVMASPTFGWSGRSLTLLDPTYASKYIPIIASVSEHQPPAWTSYIMDLHIMVFLVPAGLVACFRPLTDASLFLVIYGVTSVYFSGIMVRLMLVLAPATCCLGGVAVSEIMGLFARSLDGSDDEDKEEEGKEGAAVASAKDEKETKAGGSARKDARDTPAGGLKERRSKDKESDKAGKEKSGRRAAASAAAAKKRAALLKLPARVPMDVAVVGLGLLMWFLSFYVFHCVWASSDAYSAPSVVINTRGRDGSNHVFDDFREAYAWLAQNTAPSDVVASWWDYGYQTTAMANRTVTVDNNTWNNTHIATVGRAMSSPEKKGWHIYRALDVKYVFVVFGGLVGYPSDDINKFLWMVRIGGGVYPEIKEPDYLGGGYYRVDAGASPVMLDSLMYKLCYYRYAEASRLMLGQEGMDRVRGYEIGRKDVQLRYFEEVFTSEHWMMRVYRVRDVPLRDVNLPNPRRVKGRGPVAKARKAAAAAAAGAARRAVGGSRKGAAASGAAAAAGAGPDVRPRAPSDPRMPSGWPASRKRARRAAGRK